MYKTGHGGIQIRSKTHMEEIKTGKGGKGQQRPAIVVTELPYQVNKAALLEKIAELVNDKKIEGVADLRDESDRDGIRVVIELKRDAVPAVVQVRLLMKISMVLCVASLARLGLSSVVARLSLVKVFGFAASALLNYLGRRAPFLYFLKRTTFLSAHPYRQPSRETFLL